MMLIFTGSSTTFTSAASVFCWLVQSGGGGGWELGGAECCEGSWEDAATAAAAAHKHWHQLGSRISFFHPETYRPFRCSGNLLDIQSGLFRLKSVLRCPQVRPVPGR